MGPIGAREYGMVFLIVLTTGNMGSSIKYRDYIIYIYIIYIYIYIYAMILGWRLTTNYLDENWGYPYLRKPPSSSGRMGKKELGALGSAETLTWKTYVLKYTIIHKYPSSKLT